MSDNDVDSGHLRLHKDSPSEETNIVLEEHTNDVFVVVTQLYCQNGHNLIGLSDETFDSFPGISLWVEGAGKSGEVVVSPIHGDSDKRGLSFPNGTKLSIQCPVCKAELPELTNCRCTDTAKLRKAYLTPKLSEAHIVAVCDIWGCQLSRVIDSYEMFSEFLEGRIGD
ncbi:MAG: hypothetical protein ABI333_28545 [bacterium]